MFRCWCVSHSAQLKVAFCRPPSSVWISQAVISHASMMKILRERGCSFTTKEERETLRDVKGSSCYVVLV